MPIPNVPIRTTINDADLFPFIDGTNGRGRDVAITGADLADAVAGVTGLTVSDIGTTVQAWDADLDALAALTAPATKLAGIETGATADQTAAEILAALLTVDGSGSGLDADLLDGTSSAGFATASHNHSGVYQPVDTDLTAIAALTSAADKVPYSTGAGTWALADFTAAARTVLDDTTTAAMLATLGGIAGIRVEDEGSSTVATATALNFVGSAVTVTDAGSGEATVTITGGGSSDPLDGNAIVAQRIFVR